MRPWPDRPTIERNPHGSDCLPPSAAHYHLETLSKRLRGRLCAKAIVDGSRNGKRTRPDSAGLHRFSQRSDLLAFRAALAF